MPRSILVGYQHFRGPCCLHHLEDGDSKVFQNDGILLQHYMAPNSEGLNGNLHQCENLKSYITVVGLTSKT